jgi:hypothetical protein
MKNPMHDPNIDSAKSIAFNLTLPSKEEIMKNPYLYKVPVEDPSIDLHAQDLLNMSQITEEKY